MSIGGGEGYGQRDRTDEEGLAYGRGPSQTTTRTHLPGSEGTGRPPARPGRSVITVVGVVVLLIAAIAFANRSGSSDDDKSSSADQSGGPSAAQPTAPTGKQPVKGSSGGIASGFPRSEQGAQSAAANYAVALVSADIIKPSRRNEIVQQLFVPSKVSKMKSKMDKAYSTKFLNKLDLNQDGNPKDRHMKYVSRTAPVGTKVTAYGNDSAQLDVWCTGLYGMAGTSSKNPVTSDWFTMRLSLSWAHDDWKVDAFKQKDGPAPVSGDNTASSADEITHAVDQYGGFTYAR